MTFDVNKCAVQLIWFWVWPTIKRNVEAGMGMGGNGNELSGAIREWEWFFKCVNFGNGNGKDLAGMGGIGNTENHSRTSLEDEEDFA